MALFDRRNSVYFLAPLIISFTTYDPLTLTTEMTFLGPDSS